LLSFFLDSRLRGNDIKRNGNDIKGNGNDIKRSESNILIDKIIIDIYFYRHKIINK